jgi:hypothetical protein
MGGEYDGGRQRPPEVSNPIGHRHPCGPEAGGKILGGIGIEDGHQQPDSARRHKAADDDHLPGGDPPDGAQRQVRFVTAEAGMGKTTLVDAFTAQLAENEPLWIGRGQCVEQYGAGEAYLPLLEALSQLCRGPAAERVIAHLRQNAPSCLVQLPGIVGANEWAALQPQVQGVTQSRMLRELAEGLEAMTRVQALVLVLEDLHWSDASTVEALAMLARRREAAPLLVIGTYRPVELIVRAHPLKAVKQELQLHEQCAEVPLGYLT